MAVFFLSLSFFSSDLVDIFNHPAATQHNGHGQAAGWGSGLMQIFSFFFFFLSYDALEVPHAAEPA